MFAVVDAVVDILPVFGLDHIRRLVAGLLSIYAGWTGGGGSW